MIFRDEVCRTLEYLRLVHSVSYEWKEKLPLEKLNFNKSKF